MLLYRQVVYIGQGLNLQTAGFKNIKNIFVDTKLFILQNIIPYIPFQIKILAKNNSSRSNYFPICMRI